MYIKILLYQIYFIIPNPAPVFNAVFKNLREKKAGKPAGPLTHLIFGIHLLIRIFRVRREHKKVGRDNGFKILAE